MNSRREFLRKSAAGLGAAAVLGPLTSAAAEVAAVEPGAVAPPIEALESRLAQEPPPITEAERVERRARAQALMAQLEVDALLVEPGPSMLYFSGVRWGRSERLFAMLLPRAGEALFISPAFERQRAESLVESRFPIRIWQEHESPYTLVAAALREWGAATGTLALDPSARYFLARELGRTAPALRLADASPVMERTRGLKTAHEIEIMRFANRTTLEAFRAALATLREGMTQAELARNVSEAMTRLGYSGGALVLFGESSAYPHGLEKPQALRQGDVVLVDGGLSVHGYAADDTRTVVFGQPSAEQTRVFEVVLEAQAGALAAAAPGKKAGEIDAVARKVVDDAGYGPDYRLFTHRLGHGIGLEGHEWPYLVRGSEVVLEPGMSFSNEPGIYQYGKFGVRLEDIMVITETGAELLTPPATSLDPAAVAVMSP